MSDKKDKGERESIDQIIKGLKLRASILLNIRLQKFYLPLKYFLTWPISYLPTAPIDSISIILFFCVVIQRVAP